MDDDVIELAARRIAVATDGFCQPDYAAEGLRALIAEGWQFIPPPLGEPGEKS